jgi:hypothetical protein
MQHRDLRLAGETISTRLETMVAEPAMVGMLI